MGVYSTAASIVQPTLVIHGTADEIVPFGHGQVWAITIWLPSAMADEIVPFGHGQVWAITI